MEWHHAVSSKASLVVLDTQRRITGMESYGLYGPGAAIMPIMVIVIACFLVWLSIFAKNKAWLS